MNSKRTPLFFMLLLLLLLGTTAMAAEAPLPLIVSIPPQKYMLERIAGERISVTVLVKPGADPHSYEPSPSQIRHCAEAKAWFTIGVPFEDAWLSRIQSSAPDLAVISSIRNIRRLPSEEHAHEEKTTPGSSSSDAHGGEDPHVWLSPMLMREILPDMARDLAKLEPEHAAEFRANARSFADELEALDRDLMARFQAVPPEKRVFLTFHPSWRYYAYNYQLTELSIELEGKEPGLQGMKNVIDAAKRHGIKVVFVEPQFSKTAARAVAEEIGARVEEADPLAEDLPVLYKSMANKLLRSFNMPVSQ